MAGSIWERQGTLLKVVTILLVGIVVLWAVTVIVDFATGIGAGAAVAVLGLVGLVLFLDAELTKERERR